MKQLHIKYFLTPIIIFLTFGCVSASAGLFDKLTEEFQKSLDVPVPGSMNSNNNEAGQLDVVDVPDRMPAIVVASAGGNSVGGEMSNSVQITRVDSYLRGGQFGSKRGDWGLVLTVWKVKKPAALKMCHTFIYDKFSQNRNDPTLKKLQAEYSIMRGEKIVLENVRTVKGNRMCVFDKLRILSKKSKTEQAIEAKGQGLTISGMLTNQVQVMAVGPQLGSQFGAKYYSHALHIRLQNVKNIALAGNKCGGFIHERFARKGDASLKKLKAKHLSLRGENVVLENVRMAKNKSLCIYSKMHVVDEPRVIVEGSTVSGIVRGLAYGVRQYRQIPKKIIARHGRVPVIRMMLSKASGSGFASSQCKVYFSVLDPKDMSGKPDAIKKIRPNVTRVTLRDVEMLNEKKGWCGFDHYKSFNVVKKSDVAAQAEVVAEQKGELSYRYYIDQLAAALGGKSKSEIFSVTNKLKKYGYNVSTNSYKDFINVRLNRHDWMLVRFDRHKLVSTIQTSTAVQDSRKGCEQAVKAVTEKVSNKLGLEIQGKITAGRNTSFYKNDYAGMISSPNHDGKTCYFSLTVN